MVGAWMAGNLQGYQAATATKRLPKVKRWPTPGQHTGDARFLGHTFRQLVVGDRPRPTWDIGRPSGRAGSTSTEVGGRSSGAAVRRG